MLTAITEAFTTILTKSFGRFQHPFKSLIVLQNQRSRRHASGFFDEGLGHQF